MRGILSIPPSSLLALAMGIISSYFFLFLPISSYFFLFLLISSYFSSFISSYFFRLSPCSQLFSFCVVFKVEGTVTHRLKMPKPAYGCDWSSLQKNMLVTGCQDGVVRVYDISKKGDYLVKQVSSHIEFICYNIILLLLLFNNVLLFHFLLFFILHLSHNIKSFDTFTILY